MLQRRLLLTGSVLLALLGLPRDGNAGIVEVIIEMSGPKMYGVGFDCRLDFTGQWQSCKASTLTAGVLGPVVGDRSKTNFWLSLGGGYYWSADKTINGQDYDRFEVKMVTFDPMIELQSAAWDSYADLPFQLYHGLIGVTYNVLFGENFETFSNVGFKLRPIGIVIPIKGRFAFDFSYDLRLYPKGFTATDFGRIPLAPEGSGAEAVQSLVFGLRLKLD
jgi:hypothetical protein